MTEPNNTGGIYLDYVQSCHQDGEAVYECSDCGGLTCGACEMIRHGGPEISYQIVKCGVCDEPNIGVKAYQERESNSND